MSTLSTMYAEPHDSAIISSSCCLVQVSNDGDRKFFEKGVRDTYGLLGLAYVLSLLRILSLAVLARCQWPDQPGSCVTCNYLQVYLSLST